MLKSNPKRVNYSHLRAVVRRKKFIEKTGYRFGEEAHFKVAKAISDYFGMLTRVGIGSALGAGLWIKSSEPSAFAHPLAISSVFIWILTIILGLTFSISLSVDSFLLMLKFGGKLSSEIIASIVFLVIISTVISIIAVSAGAVVGLSK